MLDIHVFNYVNNGWYIDDLLCILLLGKIFMGTTKFIKTHDKSTGHRPLRFDSNMNIKFHTISIHLNY